ncbi:hypothetical protein MPSEU_000096000 [Mayamaea pseudoterrestris]|nr:hypothetical protein MPSEU_000096000 [Mayamaea pseudoterrestris]
MTLMELHDESDNNIHYSCTVVLRQSGLVYHPSIVPGQDVVLNNVRRLAWSTPAALRLKGFTTLSKDIPNYVFLVDSPTQIGWCGQSDAETSNGKGRTSSLSGTILSVHMSVAEISDLQSFRYLALTNADGITFYLFLSSFPLASDLQQALQPGASIAAYNVHRLGGEVGSNQADYCACLRSTIVLVETTSEANHGRMERSNRSLAQLQPCAYMQTPTTHIEWVLRRRLNVFLKPFLAHINYQSSRSLFIKKMLAPKMMSNGPRIAYAEFFDHERFDRSIGRSSSTANDWDEQDVDGCALSGSERSKSNVPCLLPLAVVHQKVAEQATAAIDVFVSRTTLEGYQAGYTGSNILSGDELADAFQITIGSEIYTGGILAASELYDDLPRLGCLSDKGLSLPVSTPPDRIARNQSSFIIMRLSRVAFSFVYLGQCLPDSAVQNNDIYGRHTQACNFPKHNHDGSRAGSCVVVRCSTHLFVVSFRLDCDRIVDGAESTDLLRPKSQRSYPVKSIRECLEFTLEPSQDAQVCALLVRKFFKPEKLTNGFYKGSMFVLSHVMQRRNILACTAIEPSLVQTIDIKPPAQASSSKQQTVRQTVFRILGFRLSDEQLAMAVAWWSLADNERSCTLLDGGWEEVTSEAPQVAKAFYVLVHFPESKLVIDQSRGYLRVRCSIEDLSAFPCALPVDTSTQPSVGKPTLPHSLHFVGGKRFFPGMLSLRPRRRGLTGVGNNLKLHGELLDATLDAATPTVTLAELHWCVCKDLQFQTKTSLAPSLVRRLKNASTLGIVYCSAVAECTKCFSPLKFLAAANGLEIGAIDGLRSSVPLDSVQPSFWGRSLPGAMPTNGEINALPPKGGRLVPFTKLRCPKNCSIQYAGVKWECSGILDDGTGQAKLLAERDVALAWLGMSHAAVRHIEQGVWSTEKGIVFSKGMPPKSYLRSAVQNARSSAQNEGRHCPGRQLRDQDVFKYLTTTAYGEYLMQRHCRESQAPLRNLTYYVRCKPMSDVLHLHQTCIDLNVPGVRQGEVHRRDMATYSLPALKLNLVDCSIDNTSLCRNYSKDLIS